jgi:hypothetical protein
MLSPKTFRARLVEVIDQAQHFAALGPVGAGGSSGDSAQAFREGLDATERERECYSIPTPSHELRKWQSSRWHRKAQKGRKSGMTTVINQGDETPFNDSSLFLPGRPLSAYF